MYTQYPFRDNLYWCGPTEPLFSPREKMKVVLHLGRFYWYYILMLLVPVVSAERDIFSDKIKELKLIFIVHCTCIMKFYLHSEILLECWIHITVTVCVFVRHLFSFYPFYFDFQCTHYFWRFFRFLFMEHKQDYRVTSLKDAKVCF